MAYFGGIWEEAELILRIWGAKEKYFQGAEVLSFRDLGRSMNYFQGSREQRPPGGILGIFAIFIGYGIFFKIINGILGSPSRAS